MRKKPPLTKKKTKDGQKNRNVVLRGGQLNYNASHQNKYAMEIKKNN